MKMSTQASDGEYNIMLALRCFSNSVSSDGVTIDLPKFIIAYKELIKFFDKLGKIFTFVAADLIDKFQNIEKCLSNDESGVHYLTVQSAIEYEKTQNSYKINHNATLSILRLIRGLDFIRHLIQNLCHASADNKKTHEIAVNAYETTLAFRHKWTIRQLVKAGFYLLPKKSDLIEIMLHGADNISTKTQTDAIFNEFLSAINKVYLIIYKIYDENNFLELVLA